MMRVGEFLCGCCEKPYNPRQCYCDKNEACQFCGHCLRHCKCGLTPQQRAALH